MIIREIQIIETRDNIDNTDNVSIVIITGEDNQDIIPLELVGKACSQYEGCVPDSLEDILRQDNKHETEPVDQETGSLVLSSQSCHEAG